MVDFRKAKWINKPTDFEVTQDSVSITTSPETDFWQRSYYGFRNDNAPALLLETDQNFSFTVKVNFVYNVLFDQCGLIVYVDSDTWFKASIEYENEQFSRLGSVVTNFGYSDWATTDVALPNQIWYRLHRRGPDLLVESSADGVMFGQMRIFHLHKLGETTEEMGKSDPPLATGKVVSFGMYACSPSNSTFTAKFSDMTIEPCRWQAHQA
jgi:regulation of enolase protein 1 (concanavalin A-like superfamily)